MKRILLPLMTILSIAMFTFAADGPKGTLHFSGAEVQQVLRFYTAISGLELFVDSRVKTVYSTISLQAPEALAKEEALKRIEKALLEQANVVITRLDEKRASVTYNDALPVVVPNKTSAQ